MSLSIKILIMSSLFYLNDGFDVNLINSTSFNRIVPFDSLYDILYQIYYDRINTLFSYEDSILIIITNDNIIPISLLDNIISRFLPILNYKIFNSKSITSINTYLDTNLINDISIIKNDIIRTDHWMYYDNNTSNCTSYIYSMAKHFINYKKLNSSHTSIPLDIQNINFSALLDINNDDSSSHFLKLLDNWSFSAIDFSIKDLIKCTFFLLKNLLRSIDSDLLSISDNNLLLFILTIESSYHQINKFHNFRHAVDVMQATYNLSKLAISQNNSNIILLLCLSALGHDLGHPGTNNIIMSKDISNDINLPKTSILENFHQSVFIYLINDQWPNLINFMNINFKDIFKNSILSTDMSFHNDYVDRLIKYNDTNKTKDTDLDMNFLISLIIKAADISNVTRPLIISSQWAYLITLEFNNFSLLNDSFDSYQTFKKNKHTNINKNKPLLFENFNSINTHINMINDLSLALPDLIEKYPSIINGQLFFINNFAESFFTQLAIALPQLNFLINNINSNKDYWLIQHNKREQQK